MSLKNISNKFIKFKPIVYYLPNFLSFYFSFFFYFLNTFQVSNITEKYQARNQKCIIKK